METTITEHWIANNMVSIVVAIIAAMTPVITLVTQRYFSKKDKTPHSITNAVVKNQRIEALLNELMTKLQPHRITVSLFHNGGYYYTGAPIQKLSVVCEKNAEGVENLMHLFQNFSISIFQRNLEKLIANDEYYEYNELQHNDSAAVINKMYDVISYGMFKLRNAEGYFCGILSVAYSGNHRLTEGEAEIARNIAKKIQSEITNVKGI
jgi:hypothetical protein